MRRLAVLTGGVLLIALGATAQAWAQLADPPSPCSVFGAEPCHPEVCGAFHDGRCFPDHRVPVRQSQRITLAASEETSKDKPLKDRRDEGQLVNTLHDMFEALRVCWMPPPPVTLPVASITG